MILPRHRESCGLSWFWVSLSLFQTWNRNVRKTDSFICHSDVLRLRPQLHGQCGIQHPFSSFWKGGRRRQVSDHMVLLPSYLIESTGTWAREMEKWNIFVGCKSHPRKYGENGLWWKACSILMHTICKVSVLLWCLPWLVEVNACLNLYHNIKQWHCVPDTVFRLRRQEWARGSPAFIGSRWCTVKKWAST